MPVDPLVVILVISPNAASDPNVHWQGVAHVSVTLEYLRYLNRDRDSEIYFGLGRGSRYGVDYEKQDEG